MFTSTNEKTFVLLQSKGIRNTILFHGDQDLKGLTELRINDNEWFPIDENSDLGPSNQFSTVTLKNTVYRFGGHIKGSRSNRDLGIELFSFFNELIKRNLIQK